MGTGTCRGREFGEAAGMRRRLTGDVTTPGPGQAGDMMSPVSSDVTPIAARLLSAYEEAGRSDQCLVILPEGSVPAAGIKVIRARGSLIVEVPPGTDVQAVFPQVDVSVVRLPPLPEVGPVTLTRVATDDPGVCGPGRGPAIRERDTSGS